MPAVLTLVRLRQEDCYRASVSLPGLHSKTLMQIKQTNNVWVSGDALEGGPRDREQLGPRPRPEAPLRKNPEDLLLKSRICPGPMTNTTQIKEWSQESSASLSRVLRGNSGPHVHPQPQGLSSLLSSGLLKSSCLTYVVARQPGFVAV